MVCTRSVHPTPCHSRTGRGMPRPDLNLLVTLDVLLAEGSVARAARRLRLSPSAMSRALARLRDGDGRSAAGQGRTRPGSDTPGDRAARAGRPARAGGRSRPASRAKARPATGGPHASPCAPARASSRPSGRPSSPASPRRRRACGCAFVPSRTRTARRCARAASTWRPASSARRSARRCGHRPCSRTGCVGVVRPGHPLAAGENTPARYAAGGHVLVSRRGRDRGPIDEALEALGLVRDIAAIVGGFAAALALARASDLIASGSGAAHRGPARRHARLSPALPHARAHGLPALAPPPRRRPRASLAARPACGRSARGHTRPPSPGRPTRPAADGRRAEQGWWQLQRTLTLILSMAIMKCLAGFGARR